MNNVAIQNNSKGDMGIIIKYIEKNGSITRINAQALINKEKTTTSTILNKLVENGVLVKIGNGPSTRYEINNNLKVNFALLICRNKKWLTIKNSNLYGR